MAIWCQLPDSKFENQWNNRCLAVNIMQTIQVIHNKHKVNHPLHIFTKHCEDVTYLRELAIY